MHGNVQGDLSQSSADFVRVVWPVIKQHCPELHESVLRLVEGHTHTTIAYELDVCAGIDAYQRTAFGLRGISSRVQWGTNYQTFTVRLSRPNGAATEYIKRLTTLKRRAEGFLYPYWTVQAYLNRPGGTLLSVAVAKTIELYLYIEQRDVCGRPCDERLAANGGERFLFVDWNEYALTRNYLFVYPGLALPSSSLSEQ